MVPILPSFILWSDSGRYRVGPYSPSVSWAGSSAGASSSAGSSAGVSISSSAGSSAGVSISSAAGSSAGVSTSSFSAGACVTGSSAGASSSAGANPSSGAASSSFSWGAAAIIIRLPVSSTGVTEMLLMVTLLPLPKLPHWMKKNSAVLSAVNV